MCSGSVPRNYGKASDRMTRRPKSRRIRSLPEYSIACPRCREVFPGRFFSEGWCSGKVRYCDKCANLKLWRHSCRPDGPMKCECGGSFTSLALHCPSCNDVFSDATLQLAAQHYGIESARDPEHPTPEEILAFVEQIHATDDLFVQLRRVMSFDEKKPKVAVVRAVRVMKYRRVFQFSEVV